MSYVALATDRFDAMARFYGEALGFPVVTSWDRSNGRGRRYDLQGGLRLELLDNGRERLPLNLGEARDRLHLVIEVEDVDSAHRSLRLTVPEPRTVSWGACLFNLRDPDGTLVTFLEWGRDRVAADGHAR